MIQRCAFIACLAICSGVRGQDVALKVHLRDSSIVGASSARFKNVCGLSGGCMTINGDNGATISIEDVAYIDGYDQQHQYRYFKPIQFEGARIWSERTYSSDRIKLYYKKVNKATMSTYKSKHFVYSKDNGPVKAVTRRNLQGDLGDSEDASAHINKGQGVAISQEVLRLAGAALVLVGALTGTLFLDFFPGSSADDSAGPLLFSLGVVAIVIPEFLVEPRQRHYVEALKAYK